MVRNAAHIHTAPLNHRFGHSEIAKISWSTENLSTTWSNCVAVVSPLPWKPVAFLAKQFSLVALLKHDDLPNQRKPPSARAKSSANISAELLVQVITKVLQKVLGHTRANPNEPITVGRRHGQTLLGHASETNPYHSRRPTATSNHSKIEF